MHTVRRQPVKVTYAHKRNRTKPPPKTTSSPLEDLSPDRYDITRAEMSRRMLKRSRGIAARENDGSDQTRLKGRPAKRARQTAETSHPNPLPLEPNINTFQTPFPFTEYVHPSSVTRPLAPENLSPVPHAKRIVSRPSSRNLKENTTSLPLASPFHSRPSSPHLPPLTKAKTRSYRIPLNSKSNTLPGAMRKNHGNVTVHRVFSPKDSTISINVGKLSRQVSLNDSKLSRNNAMPSPDELASTSSLMHRRHISSLNPAYMLSRVPQQYWISKPETDKELHIRPCQVENPFSFTSLVDRPQFCSTPQHRISGSRTGPRAPRSPPRLAFLAKPAHVTVYDQDIEMENDEIPKIHIPSNSIISSSGSFTLRTRLNLEVNDDHNINESTGSAPMSLSADVLPQKVSMDDHMVPLGSSPPYDIQKVSMGNHMVPLWSSPFHPLAIDNPEPHGKISLGRNVIPLPVKCPLVSPDFPLIPTRTVANKQIIAPPISSALNTQDSAAKCIATVPLPLFPTCAGDFSGTSNVGAQGQGDLVQDMLSLGIGGRNHDAGTRSTQLPERTRSLDRSSCVSSKKPSAAEYKRNRADTIRASDFARLATNGQVLTSLAPMAAGRTRSGTVVGSNSKLAVSLPKGSAKKRSVIKATQWDINNESVDELAILVLQEGRGLRGAEDPNCVGLAQRKKGKTRKEKVVHDDLASDDPLLIIGPWKDEDWF